MDTGELLTRGAACLAMTLLGVGLALGWTARGLAPRLARARLAWTAGCLVFVLHVACAFGFYHGWSHAAAYAATARETAVLVGWDWGGGLYANYLFTLVWAADAAWWWRGLESYESRHRSIDWAVQGFLLFMVFNATVVFGQGPVRWLGLAAFVLLLTVRILSRRTVWLASRQSEER
jgi:hypothetical protein